MKYILLLPVLGMTLAIFANQVSGYPKGKKPVPEGDESGIETVTKRSPKSSKAKTTTKPPPVEVEDDETEEGDDEPVVETTTKCPTKSKKSKTTIKPSAAEVEDEETEEGDDEDKAANKAAVISTIKQWNIDHANSHAADGQSRPGAGTVGKKPGKGNRKSP